MYASITFMARTADITVEHRPQDKTIIIRALADLYINLTIDEARKLARDITTTLETANQDEFSLNRHTAGE